MRLRQACCHHRLALSDRKWLDKLISIGKKSNTGPEEWDEDIEDIEDARSEEEVLLEVYEA